MRAGGLYGNADIRHFNGGLFDGNPALELEGNAMLTLQQVSDLDWSAVEPSIFGTLFERGLDPDKRAQLGAHYTDRSDIELIVEPVLMAPLRREWEAVKARILLPSPVDGGGGTSLWEVGGGGHELHTRAEHQQLAEVNDLINAFHDRLAGTRVLDPACGSGNFLYVALRAMLTLEKEVITFCDALGLPRPALKVSPAQLFGIELNPYAHELAQATVWIGYIQWRHENGFGDPDDPILRKLDNIQNKDAILDMRMYRTIVDGDPQLSAGDGSDAGVVYGEVDEPGEPEWPAADVIIGNPPFLGTSKQRLQLSDQYIYSLRNIYKDRVPAGCDLVCYWFDKAREQIKAKKSKRAGLVATQAIRMGASRKVLDSIKRDGDLFFAWSDHPWVLDGASVRISLVGFDDGSEKIRSLNGMPVNVINADLTSRTDLTLARSLDENRGMSFMGPSAKGPFEIDESTAHKMLALPTNVNGRPNSDVVRPVANAADLVQEPRHLWTIDFGQMDLEDAALYEAPFEYLKLVAYPIRSQNRRASYAQKWWQYAEPRPGMRSALKGLKRYIATPGVAKHRIFAWVNPEVLCNQRTTVFARDDDYFFGVLHSRVHELWALATSSRHGVGNDPTYNNSTCFETFPFPWPPAHELQDDPRVHAIAQAARELVEKRDRWLAEGATEIDPAYLTGLNAAKKRKKAEARTLTNLYNQRPTWLDLAHRKLDRAVLDAYGWPHDLSDEEILSRLLALNGARRQNNRDILRFPTCLNTM
jgi:type II restriction/modification system DNA methylase subunit YeeA